ncbi:MAG: hypothetical protein J6V80_04270 [Clostridia bacterium]|nr:hypothetical protein [Clostridia bacterium]
MHKVETILFGIAILLFGIASLLIYKNTEWGFFEVAGVIAPILGLGISTLGVFYEGNSGKNDE